MPLQQISAADIAEWDSLADIAATFEKRGLKIRDTLGDENELVLQLTDREFIVIVEAGPGQSASDYKPDDRRRRTNLVATNDYEEFTFLTRIRALDGQQHGRIKHQKLSFTKEQITREGGEKNTILQKLNSLEYGSAAAIYDDLYDTKHVVKEFYQQFETLRTDLVQEVAGIPDDRGDAKQRYVQVTLDRMIFLYFIQEKRLLDRNPNYLHEQHKERVDGDGNVYEEFYEPLFFDFLAEKGKKSTEFGALPYLNGGLFSKNPIEEEFEDARLGDTTEHTNELFGDILDFLSDWNWNVDERLDIVDPKNLSPAILGHIFEQTVNQKEMGAYYTPEEITGFMSRRTIHPYLLDQLNDEVGAEYEEIDDVFGFPAPDTDSVEALADGGAVTTQVPTENVQTRHVETLYHDFLKETRVLDPAVGSGAFLLAAQEVLLDIYMQCIEFFQQLKQNGQAWELENRTIEELEEIESGRGGASLYAKRAIILNNLYGVDIDDGAVEICKLRLWLSMVADIEDEPSEVEPLPNIDFNIRQGNSLIGYTDATEMATESGDVSLANYGGGVGENVREMFDDVIEAVEQHREAVSASEATNARRLAESRISQYSADLDEKIRTEFEDKHEDRDALSVSELSPFHWVLEFATVYSEGGFDVTIGNPPWDRVKPLRDDYFVKHDPQFRTRLPEAKDDVQDELLEDDDIASGWESYKSEMKLLADYFNTSSEYSLQAPTVAGRTHGTENDLSALFLERVLNITRPSGYVAQIVPGTIFTGSSGKDLRMHLLNNTTVQTLVHFMNHGIFENIDSRFKFSVISFRNSGATDSVKNIYAQGDIDALNSFDEKAFRTPREVLADYSPEARTFPLLENKQQSEIIMKLVNNPSVSEPVDDAWDLTPYAELHRTNDTGRFVEDPDKGDYPVYGGKNIYQYTYDTTFLDVAGPEFWSVDEKSDPSKSAKRRIREKNLRLLKRSIYDAFDGTGSQKGFVNDLLEENRGHGLSEQDVLLDCSTYRIVYRDITSSTNEHTIVAAVIPPGVVCHNKLHTVRPYRIIPERENLKEETLHSAYEKVFTPRELFVALGLINSIPFDFLMKTKIDTTVVMYKFKESQVPRLTEGDNWFEYISERAAQLNCYGDAFKQLRDTLGITAAEREEQRQELQAEIDAAACHAYGLVREDVEYVLSNFPQVSSPRIMTDEYFDMVLEKYDMLAKKDPKP